MIIMTFDKDNDNDMIIMIMIRITKILIIMNPFYHYTISLLLMFYNQNICLYDRLYELLISMRRKVGKGREGKSSGAD